MNISALLPERSSAHGNQASASEPWRQELSKQLHRSKALSPIAVAVDLRRVSNPAGILVQLTEASLGKVKHRLGYSFPSVNGLFSSSIMNISTKYIQVKVCGRERPRLHDMNGQQDPWTGASGTRLTRTVPLVPSITFWRHQNLSQIFPRRVFLHKGVSLCWPNLARSMPLKHIIHRPKYRWWGI